MRTFVLIKTADSQQQRCSAYSDYDLSSELIPINVSLPQPKLIAPINSKYVWIRPMQFTSPQFLRPGRTEVLFRYLGLHLSLK